MGKIISKNQKEINEDEQEIRKYEEQTADNPYGFGLQHTEDLRIISWWQRLVFDLRFRIAYALIIAIILGVAIPILIHFVFYDNSDSTIYGSCLIKNNARFQCLINNGKAATREECVSADCCWEENDNLPFKCFHSFPSAYQYTVGEVTELPPDGDLLPGDGIQITVHPNHADRMSSLTIWIKWLELNHLNLQIFNPNHYPQRVMAGLPGSDSKKPKMNPRRSMEKNGIIINHSGENEYFFIQIMRIGLVRNETIFDTRLGPINAGVNGGFMAFSTTLPTPYFYGLPGGEGIVAKGTQTMGVMNGFENAEIPFYMSMEESNSWHGMLLETTLPFMTQILHAPGLAFHLEGPKADINLHFFLGLTQNETLTQLHSYLSEKIAISNGTVAVPSLPYIPPYWGLGLHLCRKSTNASEALSQIEELNEITNPKTGERRIPYDSDCIDGDLRHPFGIDYENFPEPQLQSIVTLLNQTLSKKIVLSQKISIPFKINETDVTPIQEFLLMDKTNLSDIRPFLGMIDNKTVIYPDLFHPNIFSNLSLWNFSFGPMSPVDGLILVDNFPRNDESIDSSSCKKPDTFLQNLLFASSSIPDTNLDSDPNNGGSSSRSNPWGSICPGIHHTLSLTPSENAEEKTKTHLELHNVYGLQTLKKFRQILISLSDEENGQKLDHVLLSSSSGWTESAYFGARNGMESNFTWSGLRESLSHVLRQFALSPVTGISVCGSFLPNEYPVPDNNLCLRSYQVALLLPYVYHNYAHLNDSRGPLDFPTRYQGYLREAIRQRYTYAPYYYSLLINYQKTFVPMILPMSYEFHNVNGVDAATVFKLLDQFMIGKSILAAPIVKPELNRETYFPPGVWYDADGFVAWNDTSNGGFKVVTGYLVQTPLFLRGGHVIPTLQNPIGNSIMESRTGNYTLLVTLLPNLESKGILYADNGMNNSSPIISEINFEIRTQFQDSQVRINATISVIETSTMCDNPLSSTIIDQIKFLGFPHRFTNITAIYEEHPEIELETVPGDELDYLRIGDIAMDWCVDDKATINIIAGLEST